MTELQLNSRAAVLLQRLAGTIRSALSSMNDLDFESAKADVSAVRDAVAAAKVSEPDVDEHYANGLFVVGVYADFLSSYCQLWSDITAGSFERSWSSLQDALDALRVVKRFSNINVNFFELQLVQLETAYPYKVFASVGMFVEGFDCSICGADIDSMECPHRRGELYHGVMACGIVRGISRVDHVALTELPADKRCIIKYEDDSEHFKLVRYLSQLLTTCQCRVSDFSHLEHSYRPVRTGRRNAPCSCGSGRKFKKCCLSSRSGRPNHVDIVAIPRSFDAAAV